MRCFFNIMTSSNVAFQRSGLHSSVEAPACVGQWGMTKAALGIFKYSLHFTWNWLQVLQVSRDLLHFQTWKSFLAIIHHDISKTYIYLDTYVVYHSRNITDIQLLTPHLPNHTTKLQSHSQPPPSGNDLYLYNI